MKKILLFTISLFFFFSLTIVKAQEQNKDEQNKEEIQLELLFSPVPKFKDSEKQGLAEEYRILIIKYTKALKEDDELLVQESSKEIEIVFSKASRTSMKYYENLEEAERLDDYIILLLHEVESSLILDAGIDDDMEEEEIGEVRLID